MLIDETRHIHEATSKADALDVIMRILGAEGNAVHHRPTHGSPACLVDPQNDWNVLKLLYVE